MNVYKKFEPIVIELESTIEISLLRSLFDLSDFDKVAMAASRDTGLDISSLTVHNMYKELLEST